MKKYKYKKTFTFEGKRYYIYGDSLPEVYEKMGRKIADLESGKKTISKNMRFEDWTDEWLKTYKEPTVSPESFDSYKSNINVHILPLLGSMPIKSIKAIHCQRVINGMSGMSKKMISRINELMFSIFEDAVDNGLAVENPARKLKLPKGSKTSRRAITPTERKYILNVFESHHRAELWLSLMLYCGLRPSEAAALQWKDINIKDKVLTVNQAAKRRGTIGSPKTEAGYRKIPIPDVLMEKLHPGELFEYVCKNTQGNRLTSNSMQKMWDSFKNALNIEMGCKISPHGKALPPYRVAEDLVPYCFRHTYCTDLRDAGVDITTARVLMGHSSIAITAQIYTHETDQSFEDAARRINGKDTTPGATSKPPKTAEIRHTE